MAGDLGFFDFVYFILSFVAASMRPGPSLLSPPLCPLTFRQNLALDSISAESGLLSGGRRKAMLLIVQGAVEAAVFRGKSKIRGWRPLNAGEVDVLNAGGV